MRTRKKILFILSGSISAYKTLDLLRNLVKKNFEVETILTKSGSEFVSPLSISSITKRKIYQNMFSKKKIVDHMEHIQLSRNSDLIVVCPASANIIAKLANGFADDLASTTLAASNKLFCMVQFSKYKFAGLAMHSLKLPDFPAALIIISGLCLLKNLQTWS